MMTLVAFYLILLAVAVVTLVFVQHYRGTCELFSLRNFFLAGFVIFQLTSPAYSLLLDNFGKMLIAYPEETSLQFAAMASLFLVIFLVVYGKGWGAKWSLRLPAVNVMPSDSMMLALAVMLTVLSIVMRFGLHVGVASPAVEVTSVGLAAVACGFVGWVWARRLMNPMVLAVVVLIFALHMISLMTGAFGRRPLMAIGLALLWGMYFSRWRYLPARSLFARIALFSVPVVLLLVMFTAVREGLRGQIRPSGMQYLHAFADADLGYGFVRLIDGQNTGSNSMWLIENFPETYPTEHLMTLRYIAALPVPRQWWPDKPVAISARVPYLANIPGVEQDGRHTIGPGIIGHAGAEGGWYAVVVYAVFLSVLLRFFDNLLIRYPGSPFMVMVVGSSLSQVIGFPRGETSLFVFYFLLASGGAWIFLLLIGKPLENRYRSLAPVTQAAPLSRPNA